MICRKKEGRASGTFLSLVRRGRETVTSNKCRLEWERARRAIGRGDSSKPENSASFSEISCFESPTSTIELLLSQPIVKIDNRERKERRRRGDRVNRKTKLEFDFVRLQYSYWCSFSCFRGRVRVRLVDSDNLGLSKFAVSSGGSEFEPGGRREDLPNTLQPLKSTIAWCFPSSMRHLGNIVDSRLCRGRDLEKARRRNEEKQEKTRGKTSVQHSNIDDNSGRTPPTWTMPESISEAILYPRDSFLVKTDAASPSTRIKENDGQSPYRGLGVR